MKYYVQTQHISREGDPYVEIDAPNDKKAQHAAEKLFTKASKADKTVNGWKLLLQDAIGWRTIAEYCNKSPSEKAVEAAYNKSPSEKAVEAAYNSQPYNDLLYGDTTRPLNRDEVKELLKAAYAVDF